MADGSAKLWGRDNEFQETAPRREQTVRSEGLSGDSHGAAEESLQNKKTKRQFGKDFWSMQGDFVYRHHIEPRVQLHVPTERTFPIPLKYLDVTRSTFTDLDIAQEIEFMIVGTSMETKNFGFVDRFHEVYSIQRGTSQRIHLIRAVRLTKNQTTSRPDHMCPEAWTRIGKAAQRKEKQEWALEKPKLEYARSLRGIYSMDPSDEDYKDIVKNARRKFETPMAPAMPC